MASSTQDLSSSRDIKEEKIDGVVYQMSPTAHPKHGRIIGNIFHIFKTYLRFKDCQVFTDNIDIFLDEEETTYVQPDVSVLCDPSKFSDRGYHGSPSLVVEILSPSSVKYDTVTKFNIYQKYGVKELWIVNPDSKYLEQFVLQNGKYELLEVYFQSESDSMLTKAQRAQIIREFKTSLFDDLIITVDEIFE